MIVVVEGKNDANKIKTIFSDVDIITTNGSEINDRVIEEIRKASLNDIVVLCLDPDGPGEKIRKKIQENVPDVHQVFADKGRAISKNKKKVGIEHMSTEDIKVMFKNIKFSRSTGSITYLELYERGFMTSRSKREKLCKELKISYCNGKQLLKRLNMFGVTIEEIERYDC